VLVPSPHVTDSRTLNPVLRICLILFSVSHSFSLINYGGDSTILKKIILLFAVPIMARLRQYYYYIFFNIWNIINTSIHIIYIYINNIFNITILLSTLFVFI